MADLAENVEHSAPAVRGAGSRFGAALRREPFMAAIALMAIVGVGISVYLTTEHYAGADKRAFCPLSGGIINCGNVLTSSYSVVPGTQLPITVPGMLWFLVSGGLAVVALVRAAQRRPEPERLRAALLAWGGVGMVVVLYLVYAELVRIHFICAWCTVIHVLTLLTFLAALRAWQVGPSEDAPAPAVTQRPAHQHASAHGTAARQRALTSRAARTVHRSGATSRGAKR